MSTLMHELETEITPANAIPKPFSSVIDGMVLVCRSNSIGLTYYKVADKIFKFVAATVSCPSRIDMVFDVSQPDSLKNAVKCQCSLGKLQLKTIQGASQI